ncbi:MAG: radical SAM protein [Acidimicrobiales bacterium]
MGQRGAGFRWRVDDDDGQGALFVDTGREMLERRRGTGAFRGMEFLHVRAHRIINTLPRSGRLPFRHTINAYRGCSHACTYCFARPSHEYLGLDVDEGFERQVVVKVNAVERLRAELDPRRWAGEPIAMGTNTDPYQPAEGKYRLTRGIVQVLGRRGNPFSILTKSPLVLRDLDVLTEAAWRTEVRVDLSIGTLDEEVWRTTEPGTPHPRKRVEALARLNRAGIPSGVLLAPVLPGLSDHPEQLREVVEACLEAGATFVSPILLHLRPGAREQYLGWLALARPDLLPAYREMYGARAYPPAALRRRLARLVGAMVGRRRRPPSQQSARGHAPAPIGPSTVGDQLRLGL